MEELTLIKCINKGNNFINLLKLQLKIFLICLFLSKTFGLFILIMKTLHFYN